LSNIPSAAERLATDPAFVEAIETLEERYRRQWQTSKPEESEKRELLYVRLQVLHEFGRVLASEYEAALKRQTGAPDDADDK
jgi:hypothetical protein